MVFITTNILHVSGGSSTHNRQLKTVYRASGICGEVIIWYSKLLMYKMWLIKTIVFKSNRASYIKFWVKNVKLNWVIHYTAEYQYVLPCSNSYVHMFFCFFVLSWVSWNWFACAVGCKCRHDLKSTWPPAAMMMSSQQNYCKLGVSRPPFFFGIGLGPYAPGVWT